MNKQEQNDTLKKKLDNSIIDSQLTLEILMNFNKGLYDSIKPVIAESFPPVDNETIINMKGEISYRINKKRLDDFQKSYSVRLPEKCPDHLTYTAYNRDELKSIGKQLMPLYSFGILNGGSATSYADSGKNSTFNKDLFSLLSGEFKILSDCSFGKAKGITPAFLNPDGTPGPSFIELKMRSLLLNNCASLFQMTSFYNNDSISETYREYENSPFLKELIDLKKINICRVKTGIQPLLAAFTHSSAGTEKAIFIKENGDFLPLPGGHGQCFITLKSIFEELYKNGIRFISIGNVDNSGYTPDPVSLAILALSGKQAGFDFSYKTPVDVKGGILIRDSNGRLNCADLGVAIDKNVVADAVERDEPVLFNCATGLFNLEYLVNNIDRIINSLPMRFSDQDKDAGMYSQAEQVTWEVIGQLDDILIFAIDKYDRFLAAKTIMENLMTSGIKLESPLYPRSEKESEDLKGVAVKLSRGLAKKLRNDYGLKLENRRWVPIPAEEL